MTVQRYDGGAWSEVNTVQNSDGSEASVYKWDGSQFVQIWPSDGETNGLLLSYPIDAGSGSTIEDVESTNDGAINGPDWVNNTKWTGDYALESSASGDHVATTTWENFGSQVDTAFSIAFTVQTTATGYMMGCFDNTNNDPVGFAVRTGIRQSSGDVNLSLTMDSDGTGGVQEVYTSTGLIDDGNPHRVVVQRESDTNDASALAIYVDGSNQSLTTNTNGSLVTADFRIPVYTHARNLEGSVDGELSATLDNIQVRTDSLTTSEISDDYDNQPWSP
jgi:hypothetical protein